MLNEKGFENEYNDLVVGQGDALNQHFLIQVNKPFLNTCIILHTPCPSEKVSWLLFHLKIVDPPTRTLKFVEVLSPMGIHPTFPDIVWTTVLAGTLTVN